MLQQSWFRLAVGAGIISFSLLVLEVVDMSVSFCYSAVLRIIEYITFKQNRSFLKAVERKWSANKQFPHGNDGSLSLSLSCMTFTEWDVKAREGKEGETFTGEKKKAVAWISRTGSRFVYAKLWSSCAVFNFIVFIWLFQLNINHWIWSIGTAW